MTFHYGPLKGTSAGSDTSLEELIRAEYEDTHPGDTFDAFKTRAAFDKYDMGLLNDWLAAAAERHQRKLELDRIAANGSGEHLLAAFDDA